MSGDLYVQPNYSCPTWGTIDLALNHWVIGDGYHEHSTIAAVAPINGRLAQRKPMALRHFGNQIDLPEHNMPAFALRVHLATVLLWKHQVAQHLC